MLGQVAKKQLIKPQKAARSLKYSNLTDKVSLLIYTAIYSVFRHIVSL